MILDPVLPSVFVIPASVLLAIFALWRMVRSHRTERLAWGGRLVMIALLMVIALRPSIPGASTGPVATGGLEVYFAVDTTSSMAAEDADGGNTPRGDAPATRLDDAKSDIASIIASLAGARFSLTTFDSSAVQRVPLTSDASALLSASDAMTQEVTYYSSGSGIDVAVPFITDLLATAQADDTGSRRVLFYLGDGEQTISRAPGSFDQLAPLIDGGAVLGYGTHDGGRMRVFDGFGADDAETQPTYIQDPAGTGDALSIIDEQALQSIADQLRVPLAVGASDELAPILQSIDVGDVRVQAPTVDGPIEFYWIFAIPLGLLALVEVIGVVFSLRELRPSRSLPTRGEAR